ncbi:hypothetical protein R1sor_002758 [Riccia sorocarpa]|uniref:Pentatricopeptide repeat-containing protein n=1 Tax=Riccia sorocarpa TaxID=122646 RepID=A0ABD3H1T5_9MARC
MGLASVAAFCRPSLRFLHPGVPRGKAPLLLLKRWLKSATSHRAATSRFYEGDRWSDHGGFAAVPTSAARSVFRSLGNGVKLDEKPDGEHWAASTWGYRAGVVMVGQPLRRCSHRQYSTKATSSAYRSSIIEKGTKNMIVTPKKWKRTLPSKEVLNAVYSLRRVKRNPDGIKEVLKKYVSRLLKLEMMLVLSELQRLDEWHLAHQVFTMIRKESWYRPDVYLFQTMVQVFGKNKQIKLAEKMIEDLEDEGLQPDDSIKRELLRSYVMCGMMPEAIHLYKEILKLGKDQAARSILFHGLSPEDKEELAHYERQEGIDWSIVEKRP